jgi:Protein of unknown function (DUF3592)
MTRTEISIHFPDTWPRVIFATLIAVPAGIFGLWALYHASLKPLATYLDGMSWRETPCTIVSSRLTTDENKVFTVDILYSYEMDGRVYRSNRYDFSRIRSSEKEEKKQAVVARYPAGSRTTCYVDPDDPAQAVLHRKFSWEGWWLGPLFLTIVVGSGAGLFFMYRHMLRPGSLRSGEVL